ncbi:hypothetical protein [Rhizobium mayense]|uniref:Uncharacterized protein n=1 Tax=Rhizobium mayense TaxID=1312184 RepID=A0ABT7K7N5_9HYPH|nr:hypothetical protein [Rhizobium mayense]MDL2403433.1 hypothetical protein [Rhizobium mayense]
MPCLPQDPSVYVDEATVFELIDEFSTRLRRTPALRAVLHRLIGNYWFEFEQNMAIVCENILLQQTLREALMDAFFERASALSADNIIEVRAVFLDACLTVLPLHAAASVSELFERAADLLQEALDWEGTAGQLERAKTVIKAGHIFR